MTDPTPAEAELILSRIMLHIFHEAPDVIMLLEIERQMIKRLGVRHVLCRYVDGHVVADVFPHSSPAFTLRYAAATVLA